MLNLILVLLALAALILITLSILWFLRKKRPKRLAIYSFLTVGIAIFIFVLILINANLNHTEKYSLRLSSGIFGLLVGISALYYRNSPRDAAATTRRPALFLVITIFGSLILIIKAIYNLFLIK